MRKSAVLRCLRQACGAGIGILFLLVVSFAVPASAQTPGAEADRLIDQGLSLREAGQDQQALPFFERAHRLAPTPRAAAQRGFVLQAVGQWARAEADLDDALKATDDAWIRSHRALLVESLTFVQARLGSLIVEANVRDAEVIVDGQPAGRTPLPQALRLTLGEHAVEVRAAGRPSVLRTADVAVNVPARVVVTLAPPPPPVTTAPPPMATAPNPGGDLAVTAAASSAPPSASPVPLHRRWYFWAGLAAIAVTVVTVSALATAPTRYECGAGPRICAE